MRDQTDQDSSDLMLILNAEILFCMNIKDSKRTIVKVGCETAHRKIDDPKQLNPLALKIDSRRFVIDLVR